MAEKQHLNSIGIDIGTTTTHLVLSRLSIGNVSAGNRAPQIEVTDREIVYRSPIHFTPLEADGSINAKAVAEIISSEYQKAEVTPQQIDTGAVIITGESARKRNAKAVAEQISQLAGDFVIAAAGPQMESILAGKGSGAAQYSADNSKTVCNIDIGGGTTNFAVFKNGVCIDHACLAIGARFIQFDEGLIVRSMTDSAEDFLDGVAKLSLISKGKALSKEHADLFSALLAEVITHTCTKKKAPQIVRRLLIDEPLSMQHKIDEYWFSGGVAECMREESSDEFRFRDMGVLLGKAIIEAMNERELTFRIAPSGIRATVIGAGHHTMQLSGCTVMVSNSQTLPLKNIPIRRPFTLIPMDSSAEQIKNSILSNLKTLPNEQTEKFAITVNDLSAVSYATLTTWAQGITDAFQSLNPNTAAIVLSETDIGLALGQAIKRQNPSLDLLILDGLDIDSGDYIDIGAPLPNHESVPVTIKTLIFGQ